MQGMSLSSLKHHRALIPLFICVGAGCFASVVYLGRLALKSPDVSWNKKGEQEPWNEYQNKQYKFYTPTPPDYSKHPAPKY